MSAVQARSGCSHAILGVFVTRRTICSSNLPLIHLPKQFVSSVANRLVLNFAAMVFLGVTFFLTWQNSAWQNLFGWGGLAFLVCGLIVSGAVIGAVSNRLHQGIAAIVVSRSNKELNAAQVAMIRWTGTAILLAQVLLVYYLTAWAFEVWLANSAP